MCNNMNSTLEDVLSRLNGKGKELDIVTHRKQTRPVEEKRKLLLAYRKTDYEPYGHVIIVQGSLLSYKDEEGIEKIILCFHNGEHRIDFRVLKNGLGIPNKRDLRFYREDIQEIIGPESGAVSPFITRTDGISGLYFDRRMVEEAQQNPTQKYDMAISTRQSLFANVADVYDALKQNPNLTDKIDSKQMTNNGPERRKGKEFCINIDDPNYGAKVMEKTRLTFFSEPFWHEQFEKRTQGRYGRHFIPLKGKEPKGLFPSCYLNVYIPGGLEFYASGQAKSGPWINAQYDENEEEYSRNVYPDRRVSISPKAK